MYLFVFALEACDSTPVMFIASPQRSKFIRFFLFGPSIVRHTPVFLVDDFWPFREFLYPTNEKLLPFVIWKANFWKFKRYQLNLIHSRVFR